MRIAVIPMMLAAAMAAADCTVTLPEDDYHRIKALLKGKRTVTHRFANGHAVHLRVAFADADRFTEQLNRRTLSRYGSLQCGKEQADAPPETLPEIRPTSPTAPAAKKPPLKLVRRFGQ
ncbi:hypothetical protein [Conchiformibius steedae]|uniref:hypothetical protein n=1 Tax=Conchiformibius steedae TaxID=153493 RepID=UPI0026EDEBE9|nr:hypothetical protein [Conchiformibius steedae]